MPYKRSTSREMPQALRGLISRSLLYFILVAMSLVMLLPLAWMFTTSLKPDGEIVSVPPQFIPDTWRWSNYGAALDAMKFPLLLRNTIVITAINLLGVLASSSLVAYPFARLRFPGKTWLFLLVLSTTMLPYAVTMIPIYIIFARLHWIDTFRPLTIPAFFGGGAFNIFLLRQFYMTIPRELDEAAIIDGCGVMGVFWNVLLPLAKPGLTAVAIFTFIGTWNDFLMPLLYLNSRDKMTLAVGLDLFKDNYFTQWNYLMAASLVVMLPCAFIFILAQRYFVEGIALSGIKG
ncbi:MAG: carbohydrate ABC transporter permease [Anaerolineae bacterium]